jgi:hypothetical protein
VRIRLPTISIARRGAPPSYVVLVSSARASREPARPAAPRWPTPPPGTWARVRRIALVASLVLLVLSGVSYVEALTRASNSSFGIRTVEWLRDNGAAGLVARAESTYYALNAPSKGGPTLRALPRVGDGAAAAAPRIAHEYRPPRVRSLLHPRLPSEGVWNATRPGLESHPPILLTTLRDQPEYPRVLVGLAWINAKRVSLALHPGRLEPSVQVPRGSMDVPAGGRHGLLATFNSGFKLADSHGGFVVGGQTYARMRKGEGTLVGYSDGRVDVLDWNHGAIAPPGVSFARQNLPLIVSEGRLNPGLANGGEWGATVGNATLVWRSAIGVDRNGNLIYAAGENQTVRSLAEALLRAGAVRAMELDINSYWVSFITYAATGARRPKNLLPAMERSASRYLEPDDRDFFTVSAR